MALAPPAVPSKRLQRRRKSGSFANLTFATKDPVHEKHEARVRQCDDREYHAHCAGIPELALSECGVEELLGHDQGRVIGPATWLQSSHVDEGIQRKNPDVDESRLHILADQRDGDRNRRSETSGAVDPGSLEDLGGDALN